MCRISRDILHNLYITPRNLESSKLCEDSIKLTSYDLHDRVQRQNIRRATITCIYDIRTIYIYYHIFDGKKQKLADVVMSPYIEKDIYITIIKFLAEFFTNKKFSIVSLDNDYVYLYYNQECINTMINNVILYHTSYNKLL